MSINVYKTVSHLFDSLSSYKKKETQESNYNVFCYSCLLWQMHVSNVSKNRKYINFYKTIIWWFKIPIILNVYFLLKHIYVTENYNHSSFIFPVISKRFFFLYLFDFYLNVFPKKNPNILHYFNLFTYCFTDKPGSEMHINASHIRKTQYDQCKHFKSAKQPANSRYCWLENWGLRNSCEKPGIFFLNA